MAIIDAIGEPALLEHVAEECTELAQACLKLARVERGENPTPYTEGECQHAVIEEWADLQVMLWELEDANWIDRELFKLYAEDKTKRMHDRIRAMDKSL